MCDLVIIRNGERPLWGREVLTPQLTTIYIPHFFLPFAEMGIKSRALCMLGKYCYTHGLCSVCLSYFFLYFISFWLDDVIEQSSFFSYSRLSHGLGMLHIFLALSPGIQFWPVKGLDLHTHTHKKAHSNNHSFKTFFNIWESKCFFCWLFNTSSSIHEINPPGWFCNIVFKVEKIKFSSGLESCLLMRSVWGEFIWLSHED